MGTPLTSSLPSLRLEPIGFIKTSMRVKFETPHQPTDPDSQNGIVELISDHNFEAALSDLEGFDHIWLIWWFHRNSTWRPKVLPPRGSAKRRGVFATRSPHRPNPIGITAVKLVGIEGRILRIGPCDLVDGTPILDIKPYIPSIDAFPTSSVGWLGEMESDLLEAPTFKVQIGERALRQSEWLRGEWSIDFLSRAIRILERNPSPHRTRRISKLSDGTFRMGCGPWRIFFTIEGAEVQITAVAPGYPSRSLSNPGYERIPDREAQVSFLKHWS